jgi:hypothetical protein
MLVCPAANPSNFFTTYVTPSITALIALAVGVVAYQQWRIARDKLRFDIYQRRFTIFSNTLDFYSKVVFGDWKDDTSESTLTHVRFFTSLHEAAFLFDPKDGVFTILNQLSLKAFHIIQMKKGILTSEMIGPELFLKEYEQFTEELAWLDKNIPLLTERIAPYLNFHKI